MNDNKKIFNKIKEQHNLIKAYHNKYLKKYGVVLPKLYDKDKKITKNALVLIFLSLGYPNTRRVSKTELTKLQKAHKDPNKPLIAGNIIPQCQKCNRGDRNRWVYDDKGRVIKLAKASFVKNFDQEVRWRIYRILYKEFNGHKTVKPVEICEQILKLSAFYKNAVVLDPFIGSGTTAVAAKNLGLNYIGIDINPEYVDIALRRLGKIKNIPKKTGAKTKESSIATQENLFKNYAYD